MSDAPPSRATPRVAIDGVKVELVDAKSPVATKRGASARHIPAAHACTPVANVDLARVSTQPIHERVFQWSKLP